MSAVAFRFLLLQFDSSELMNGYYLQMDLPQIKDAFVAFHFEQLLQFFFFKQLNIVLQLMKQ